MRAGGWNMRGFGQSGRRTQVKDYMKTEHLDIIFLQETIKQSFTDQELRNLESEDKFFWHWLPAVGHSGVLLLGVRDSSMEVGNIGQGEFYISVTILHRASKLIFEFIGVYGPADHSHSASFSMSSR